MLGHQLPAAPVASCGRIHHLPGSARWQRNVRVCSSAQSPGDAEEHAAEMRARARGSQGAGPSNRHLLAAQPPAGSEWGEGFLQFRSTGETERLDVDTLNERLQHRGAARLRHVQAPDQKYGMIFSFDGCVGNTRGALVRACAALAARLGRPPLLPHQQQALALRSTSTERLFIDILQWASDMKAAQQLSHELSELYAEQLTALVDPNPGMRTWVAALSKFNVPCALVTSLDRVTVMRLLQRMGLHDFFVAMVTGDSELETLSQRLLSVSMQLNRPPNHCVFFGDSPNDVVAAHNCTMKSVAVCSAYPAYQLKQADLTVARLSELTVYNMRRLFAFQGSEFMEYCKENTNDKRSTKRRTVNGTC